jgi:hypothetical protein
MATCGIYQVYREKDQGTGASVKVTTALAREKARYWTNLSAGQHFTVLRFFPMAPRCWTFLM